MKVLRESDEELEVQFDGEAPTIFILLKEELDKDENVSMCAWKYNHPLEKNLIFYVKTTNGKKPREVILDALKRLLDRINNFEKEYNKIINE